MFGRLTLPDHGPVFLNEGATRSELDLRKMVALRSIVSNERREELEQGIRLARAGVAGDRKIVFELANSHYPLVFIHDLCLEHEGGESTDRLSRRNPISHSGNRVQEPGG